MKKKHANMSNYSTRTCAIARAHARYMHTHTHTNTQSLQHTVRVQACHTPQYPRSGYSSVPTLLYPPKPTHLPLSFSFSFFSFLFFNRFNIIIEATTVLGALRQILFVVVSPPASLLDRSLCLDMLSLSDAYSRASIGPPGIGGPRRR